MDHMDPIDDVEIQEKVESLAGKGTRVVDCEKSTTFKTNEIVLVNGYPVPLQGEEGAQIKRMLLEGQIPSGELLNEILIRAGILTAPIELETTFNVKSTTKTTELLTLRDKNGVVLDERVKEVEEDNEFSNKKAERWQKEEREREAELRSLGRRVEKLYKASGSPSDPTGKILSKRESSTTQMTRGGISPTTSPPSPPPPPVDEQEGIFNRESKSSAKSHLTGVLIPGAGLYQPAPEVETEAPRTRSRHAPITPLILPIKSYRLPPSHPPPPPPNETPATTPTTPPTELFRSISDALSSTPLTRTPSDYSTLSPESPSLSTTYYGSSQSPPGVIPPSSYKQFHPSLSLIPTELNGKPIRFTYETFV